MINKAKNSGEFVHLLRGSKETKTLAELTRAGFACVDHHPVIYLKEEGTRIKIFEEVLGTHSVFTCQYDGEKKYIKKRIRKWGH